jgi:hypothetical protein
MGQLLKVDLDSVIRKLPQEIINKLISGDLFLAGGFIRDIIAKDDANDIDLFGKSVESVHAIIRELTKADDYQIIKTENAVTLTDCKYPIQFITKYCVKTPEEFLTSFDFTVCQVVIFFDGDWKSLISDRFYPDLAAKRLSYTKPKYNNVCGSINRMIKFIKRGYSISGEELSELLTDFIVSNNFNITNVTDDVLLKKIKNKIKTNNDY